MSTKTTEERPNPQVVKDLLEKKAALDQQLTNIKGVLEMYGYATEPAPPAWKSLSPITKAEAIEKALKKAKKPLRPKELIAAMEAEGYVFNTRPGANKANCLNNFLYGKSKLKNLVNADGRLSWKD